MDILSWTKLNPNISATTVTKRFFNRYCYKLDLEIHGSSFLRYPEVPINEQIEHRRKVNRKINFAGSWKYKTQSPDKEDIKALEYLMNNYIVNPGVFKFRIEEPTLSVYAEDEQELYDFASKLRQSVKNNRHIKRIHRPKSQAHLELLNQGYTVKESKKGFRYKVMLREGRYNYTVKQQLYNYLKNLGDEVWLPAHLKEALEKPYDSFWGSYFYCKDLSILTMMALVNPMFVRSVETYQAVTK